MQAGRSLFARLLLLQMLLGLGYVILFGVGFYAERNSTIARLVADHWAAALVASTAGVPAPGLRALNERPAHALTAPAVGPRLGGLDEALRARGVPLRSMAVVLGEAPATLWLEVAAPDGRSRWLGVPGAEILPHVPLRLLIGLGLGLALLLAVTWWFTRRLTRPLSQLRERVGSQQPGQTAPATPALAPGAPPELLAIEAEFAALLARYQRFDAERALLLAGVSHDLRSPLARIRMAAEMLPEAPEVAPRREAIVRNTRAADRLIESFLDTVRAGELPLDQACDLAEIAPRVVAGFERAPGELALRVSGPLPPVRANALLLERLLSNLIENALRHGHTPVHVVLAPQGLGVRIEVSDAGAGIPEAARAALMQAFARGDAARSAPGSGLGLAIVERITQRLGARLEMAQADGRFTVWLNLPGLR